MELLCSYKKMDKVNFLIVLKYLVPFGKSFDNIYKQDKILNINIIRLLAKHDIKRELEYSKLREKLPDRRPYKIERHAYDNLSPYSVLKSKASNNIDMYMKNYKKRYMSKKGLSKLDCYYENKVFCMFNNICDIGIKMKYNEKRAKKFFLKKYGIRFILVALTPALSLIFPIIFGVGGGSRGIIDYCLNSNHTEGKTHSGCSKTSLTDYKDIIDHVSYAPLIFSFIMITISILFIIYILIKVIKYEKMKAGKGKMNMKEYCRFCKDIF
ncbi:Plasmodium exported protein, unknown function [Plasmodium vivax]|uniref:Variable surface protein n=1 Tax=Plasmodium vivax TaxID=5855 RepID=A0A565A4K2_PLAVI|nr:Plasmodium exported protein, unknown function [Plasmodium vivax]